MDISLEHFNNVAFVLLAILIYVGEMWKSTFWEAGYLKLFISHHLILIPDKSISLFCSSAEAVFDEDKARTRRKKEEEADFLSSTGHFFFIS